MIRLYAEVVCFAMLFVLACGWSLHERHAGAREVQARWDKARAIEDLAAAKAKADNEAETARRLSELAKERDEARTKLDKANADYAFALRTREQLRVELAAYVAASRRTPANTSAPPGGSTDPTDDPVSVLAKLFSEADGIAGELAKQADAARIAGEACESAYNSLRGKNGS